MGRMGSAGLCARFHKAVELIGRRWSGAIIQILRQRPARYAELRAAIPDITDRMLSERLRELEDERSWRGRDPGNAVRSIRSPEGSGPGPALDAIGHWAEKWSKPATRPRAPLLSPVDPGRDGPPDRRRGPCAPLPPHDRRPRFSPYIPPVAHSTALYRAGFA